MPELGTGLHVMQSFPGICWQLITAESRQSRRFLECVGGKSLAQLVRGPARGSAPLDLLFTDREGLEGDVMVGGRLGHSNHKMVISDPWGRKERGISRASTLDFQRMDFGLFRTLVHRVSWETALKNKGICEGRT